MIITGDVLCARPCSSSIPVPPVRRNSDDHDIGSGSTDTRERRTGFLGFADNLHAVDCAEARGHTLSDRDRVFNEENAQCLLGRA